MLGIHTEALNFPKWEVFELVLVKLVVPVFMLAQ